MAKTHTQEHFLSFLARIKDLNSLHLTWQTYANLMQHMVFCPIVMDVNRELQFLCPVESNVFLTMVIYFLPNCFQQHLDFTLPYLSCSFPSFTTQEVREKHFFLLSISAKGPSLRTPGDWQRDQQKAIWLVHWQKDTQNAGVHNPTHAQEQLWSFPIHEARQVLVKIVINTKWMILISALYCTFVGQ